MHGFKSPFAPLRFFRCHVYVRLRAFHLTPFAIAQVVVRLVLVRPAIRTFRVVTNWWLYYRRSYFRYQDPLARLLSRLIKRWTSLHCGWIQLVLLTLKHLSQFLLGKVRLILIFSVINVTCALVPHGCDLPHVFYRGILIVILVICRLWSAVSIWNRLDISLELHLRVDLGLGAEKLIVSTVGLILEVSEGLCA